jgi:transcriptional regulator with XRE-family HTH domain
MVARTVFLALHSCPEMTHDCHMSTRSSEAGRSTTLESQVAAEIRAHLARRRMQQAELAGLVGEHPSWVSRRLGETRRITIDDLERIAQALGIGAVELLPRSAREGVSVTQPYLRRTDHATEDWPDGRPAVSDAERRHGRRRPRRISVRPEVPCALPVAA